MSNVSFNNLNQVRSNATYRAPGGGSNIGESFEDFKAQLPPGTGEGQNDMRYYLELQQQVLAETRAFETFSNIMKARHDAASTAIRNVK
jgi:hypothetical protein